MFKKLAVLFSLLLVTPFSLTIAEAAKESSLRMVYAEEGTFTGECDGYTYTQKDVERYYDSPDFVPDIVTNFWAPSGYKFTLNYTDEQLNRVFDQAEECGITYGYIDFILNYKKFGMNIYLESFINDFNGENPREDCIAWVKDKFNNFRPFYEAKEVTVETDISLNIQFYFATQYSGMTFNFEGETLQVKPFDSKDAIKVYSSYYDDSERNDRRIDIHGEIIPGFFYEPPYYNEYGFHTDTVTSRYIQTDYSYDQYDDCADYKLTLFAYRTVEIGDLTGGGGLEVTYPSHPLTVAAKLEFTSGGTNYEFWSNEFIIGDPNISVAIDGYNDRSSVQSGTEHNYSLHFDTYDNREIYSLSTRATASPLRLNKSENFIEYYDLVIPPINDSNYFLRGSFNSWTSPQAHYAFYQDEKDSNHYILRNVALDAGATVAANLGWGDRIFINAETYEGCHYTIDSVWERLEITDAGVYDIDLYLEEPNNNHVRFNLVSAIPEYTAPFYLNATSLSNPIKLSVDDLEKDYYFTYRVNLTEGDVLSVTDSGSNTFINKYTWPSCGFKLENNKMIVTKTSTYDVTFYPFANNGYRIVLKEKPLPQVGDKNAIYYLASSDEVLLHQEGKDEEFLDKPAGGQYVIWNDETKNYVNYEGISLIDFYSSEYEGESTDFISLTSKNVKIDFVGEWYIYLELMAETSAGGYYFHSSLQRLEVSNRDKTGDYIVIKTPDSEEALPDEINLLNGGDKIELVPDVASHEEGVKYYYDYEIDKEGVVEVNEGEDGRITLTTLNPGLINVTFYIECELFSTISKTITMRVLDAIYDVAKITVGDEFHYAGKDLTAYLSIRGFTKIQNINVDWTVTDKAGKEVTKEKLLINHDASLVVKETESTDYTFTAYYEGVKLDELTVQVRYVDMNKFLRANIWWIFLITISFVALLLFLKFLLNRSKTTVENIERVYQVFCQCLSDDKLTKEELIKIKKEITRCMHRCEDLNIDALNQYEKATRYLRKSLFDCKALIKDYDTTTPADRGVYTDRLDKDLAKALNVAKEIENAKGLIESYHVNANRHNFESLDDGSKKKKNKK